MTDVDQEPDGRIRRALRTRAAIVDATILLVEQGDLRPTAPRVAEAAAVSVRSIFQHFDDLETLHAAVADRLLERVALLVVPVDAALPLADRVAVLTHQRSLLLEAVTPIRRAAAVHGPFSTEITDRLRDGHEFLRAEVASVFAPELGRVPEGPERTLVLDALDVVFAWGTWEGLRASVGRDPEEAEAIVARLALGLLQPLAG